MIDLMTSRWLICTFITFLLPVALQGEEPPQPEDGLTPFTSKEGGFRIRLPGEPRYEATKVGDAQENQHQFQVAEQNGVYLISYQENPNLKGGNPKQLQAALESGRDRLQKSFSGELIESEDVQLGDKHPGLAFRITIPQARGEARCRFYLVGTRLYQVLALGTPQFVSTEQTKQVIESFELLR